MFEIAALTMPIHRKCFLLPTGRSSAWLLLAIPSAAVLSLFSLSFAQSPPERARLSAQVDADSASIVVDEARMKVRARHFIERHNSLAQTNDLDAVMKAYAENVNYYNRGLVPRSTVRADKAAYLKRWPERRFEIDKLNATIRKAVPTPQVVVSYESTYNVRGATRKANGHAQTILTLQPTADRRDFIITEEQSSVLPFRSDSATPEAAASHAAEGAVGNDARAGSSTEISRETAPASLQPSPERLLEEQAHTESDEETTEADVPATQSPAILADDQGGSEPPLAMGSQAPAAPDASQKSVPLRSGTVLERSYL